MSARIIDGKAFAAGLREKVAHGVARLKEQHGITPGLAVVLVGEDPASRVYVRNKERMTQEVGMRSFAHRLPATTNEERLLGLIDELDCDPAVHGILVQLPLPAHIDAAKVIAAIDPAKDVDGFHPVNAGLLMTGGRGMVPCTPLGCLMLIQSVREDLSGARALVVGRSNIVGKPMALLLMGENATVTIAHSRTRDLAGEVSRADILVAAVGRPEMIRGEWIRPGAIVIDVGINRVSAPEKGEGGTRLVGDVEFASAQMRAGAITPVPGGVGPMTIAVLLRNTLVAAHRQAGLGDPDI
ncbi:MAG: bifunctional methylenetetrahydrofolate dehydrogenase/methenyltetrahydrofolate cyclohydrolase FolD [Alphaproteobacteria bacterium]|nr:MAG: bifunctional methylenetetrahydrofolate dehydrogenase/methenyltetrahydrofolate cyclohydrolase FolD [Alphaproteobacteria bacterium]